MKHTADRSSGYVGAIAALVALSASPTIACDYSFPDDWVEPPVEDFIAQSDRAFIGTVVALRADDGTLVHERFDDERSHNLITAILRVDTAIRGVKVGQLVEVDHSVEGGADCGTTYTPGEVWMLPGGYFGPIGFRDTLQTAEKVAAWRALPFPAPAQEAPFDDCRPYTPTPQQLIDNLKFDSQSFVGTVTGVRKDDATLLTELPQCPVGLGPGASPECRQFWSHIVSVQFRVDNALHGISEGRVFESKVWPGDLCTPFVPGDHWLYSGWRTLRMEQAPSPAVLATLTKAAAQVD